MSIQEALHFMRKVREDEGLRSRAEALVRGGDLEELVRLAGEAGYPFTVDDLRAAFKHEWAMRWFRAAQEYRP
jgi:predicted ribosomally synthesized peptide with nif11-like leader